MVYSITVSCLASWIWKSLKMVSYVTALNPRSVSERDSNPNEIMYITNEVKGRSLTFQCRHRGGVGLKTAFEMWLHTRRNQISSFGETDESI